MARHAKDTTKDVFINCPFDVEFVPIFRAYIFVVYACGFRIRSARELDDGAQARIDKIYTIIQDCRYGIHDISRTELDQRNALPRFNMPLELGIFLGARRYGHGAQKEKRAIIFDVEKFRYQKFLSDLAGMDIHAHRGKPLEAIREARDWLANVSRLKLPSGEILAKLYGKFSHRLPSIASTLDFKVDDIPYADFERIVVEWLLNESDEA